MFQLKVIKNLLKIKISIIKYLQNRRRIYKYFNIKTGRLVYNIFRKLINVFNFL